MEVLKVENVVKKFGAYAASDNVSFTVPKGKVFGLLGPNGAGKTTMIRMITNILIPDEGNITLFGEKVNQSVMNRIGYLPEERGLYKKLKVIEQIAYFAQLKGLSKSDAIENGKQWLAKLGAIGWENKKIEELSKGMQQKIQFITTILHNPEFVILDEPFSGFDPVNTELLKNIIIDMKNQGKTIILSTHVMSQVEELCDDICMINKGKVVLEGSVTDIKSRFGRNHLIVEFEGSDDFIDKISDIDILNQTKGRLEVRLHENLPDTNEIFRIISQNALVTKFDLSLPTMHEIFIDTVEKQAGGNYNEN